MDDWYEQRTWVRTTQDKQRKWETTAQDEDSTSLVVHVDLDLDDLRLSYHQGLRNEHVDVVVLYYWSWVLRWTRPLRLQSRLNRSQGRLPLRLDRGQHRLRSHLSCSQGQSRSHPDLCLESSDVLSDPLLGY